MTYKNINKQYILKLLLKNIQHNGCNNTAKKLIKKYIVIISKSKNIHNFSTFFEDLIKNITLPIKTIKKGDSFGHMYTNYYKNVSYSLINFIQKIKKPQKINSFGFYLENEINKLLDSTKSYLNLTKINTIKSYINTNVNVDDNINLKKKINIKNYISKENTLQRYFYNYINFNTNKKINLCYYKYKNKSELIPSENNTYSINTEIKTI